MDERINYLRDDGSYMPSEELLEVAREHTGGRCLLGVSGKDSLAMWLWLRENDFAVTPYSSYFCPDLSYEQEWLDYLESFFGVHIMRLPSDFMYDLLLSSAFQPLDRTIKIFASGINAFTDRDVEEYLAKENGMYPNHLVALGFRLNDSFHRRGIIKLHGTIGKIRKYWYAIFDWNNRRVWEKINQYDLKMPRLYSIIGNTGMDVGYNYMKVIRDDFPNDFEKIREWFPMIDIIFFRYERVR